MKHIVNLSEEQRSRLENMISSGRDSARVLSRARVLLLCDQSLGVIRDDEDVAEAVMVCAGTVRRLRKEFTLSGLEAAIYDKPRPGRVPKITGDIEAKITALACSDPPDGRERWTLRLPADKVVALEYVDSISHTAIADRLKK